MIKLLRCSFATLVLLSALFSTVVARAQAADVSDLIGQLSSADEAVRVDAIHDLARSGADANVVVPALKALLEDESARIRAHAARALGKIGEPAKPAVDVLVRLVDDPEAVVRREALDAVIAIRPGPEVGIPLFLKIMEGDDHAIKVRALDEVTNAGAEAMPFLLAMLGKKEAVYWGCLLASEIGPDAAEAVPALIEALGDEQPGVRREAMIALAAVGKASAPAIGELAKGLDDEVNHIPATYALGTIGGLPSEVEKKIRQNSKSDDGVLATVSMWALAKLHPDDKELVRQAVEALGQSLQSDDERRRVMAAQSLIDLEPDPEIAKPIISKILKNARPEVVSAMMDAVATLGEDAVPRMIDLLKMEDSRPRAAAILARIGPKAAAAVPALADALADENPETRSEILMALAAIGPSAAPATAAVIELLGDPEEDVCYAACFALGQIGLKADAAKEHLGKCLAGDDEFLCMAAAWALACTDPFSEETAAKAVPVLAKALVDPEPMTRLQAAQVLGRFGSLASDALPELEKLLEDSNADIKAAAAETIKVIKSGVPAIPDGLEVGTMIEAGPGGVVLKLGAEVVAELPEGEKLMVLSLKGKWVGLSAVTDDGKVKGWALRRNL